MTKQPDIDWTILDRYFRREALPEQVARLEKSCIDPEAARLVNSVREIWDAANVATRTSTADVEIAWSALTARIDADGSAAHAAPVRPIMRLYGPKTARPTRIWFGALAASIAGTAIVLGIQRTIVSREVTGSDAIAAEREFATRRAQRADIYLSDGTHVILNVDSRLQLAADFGVKSRDVTLVGEAFFEVAGVAQKPFRVHTAKGVVQDISTAFVVAHYPEAQGMKVGVASGSVFVQTEARGTAADTLAAGDLARVDGAGTVRVQRGADIRGELAWTTGTLVFDRVPLREVMARLSRWCDAEIRLGDSTLANVKYTASVRNEPVSDVLEMLAVSLDARVERDSGGAYVVYAARR